MKDLPVCQINEQNQIPESQMLAIWTLAAWAGAKPGFGLKGQNLATRAAWPAAHPSGSDRSLWQAM